MTAPKNLWPRLAARRLGRWRRGALQICVQDDLGERAGDASSATASVASDRFVVGRCQSCVINCAPKGRGITMRIPIAAILLAASALIAGPAQTQQAADQKGDAFHRCTSDMALWVLRRKDGEVDKKRIVDEVLSSCILRAAIDALTGPQREAWMTQAKREVAAQIEKAAPRAKAERADEDQAGADYFLCLERHAKILALASDETADIVAQASLSSCPTERRAIFEVHRRYNDDWNEGTIKAMENVLVQHLLLEIVKIRAQRNVTPVPAPEPKPRKTPI